MNNDLQVVTDPFSLIFEHAVDADIAKIKSNMIILLMSELKTVSRTRKGMAEVLGCSAGEMSRIANAQMTSISIEKLIKHLATLNVRFKSELDVSFGDEQGNKASRASWISFTTKKD